MYHYVYLPKSLSAISSFSHYYMLSALLSPARLVPSQPGIPGLTCCSALLSSTCTPAWLRTYGNCNIGWEAQYAVNYWTSLSPYICSSCIRMSLVLPCWTQAHSCSPHYLAEHTLNLDLKCRAWTLA